MYKLVCGLPPHLYPALRVRTTMRFCFFLILFFFSFSSPPLSTHFFEGRRRKVCTITTMSLVRICGSDCTHVRKGKGGGKKMDRYFTHLKDSTGRSSLVLLHFGNGRWNNEWRRESVMLHCHSCNLEHKFLHVQLLQVLVPIEVVLYEPTIKEKFVKANFF